jgi:triacylglycerol lipase
LSPWNHPNGFVSFITPIDCFHTFSQGTYLGTLSQVNHLDLVGWVNTARYKWAEIMGKEIKFHPATFYLGIADMLAREVEGQGQDQDQVDQDSHDNGEIEKPKVGPGVELEEHPRKPPTGEEEHSATSQYSSKP